MNFGIWKVMALKLEIKIPLRNNKRNDRKGRKFTFKRLGPYEVDNLTDHTLVSLKNLKSNVFFKKSLTSFLLSLI